MEKKKRSIIVSTQIRLAEDLYEYARTEADRLGISLNAVLNSLIDDGRRFRKATVIIQMEPQ